MTDTDTASHLKALRKVIGQYPTRRLQEGKALLHVWRGSTPWNYWVAPVTNEHRHNWHSSEELMRPLPKMKMFELVENKGGVITPSPVHREGGQPFHSIYRLKPEYRKDAR